MLTIPKRPSHIASSPSLPRLKLARRRDELPRIRPLLRKVLRERCNARQDPSHHEQQRDYRPNHSPALRRPSIPLRKDARIRAIHLPQDKIIALHTTLLASATPHKITLILTLRKKKENSRYPKRYTVTTSLR
jgi:hypothetical protein